MKKLTKTQIRNRMNQINDIDDIEMENNLVGCFFSKNTMRFFSSRKLQGIYKLDKRGKEQRILFLTSEKAGFNDYTRVYSVNVFNPETRKVETYRKQQFDNARHAKNFAEKCQAIGQILNKEE